MDELRWGILGTAKIARDIVIPAIQTTDRCRVVAIGSRDIERAREVARANSIERTHESYDALLADPQVDAVYIPLPNHLHREWTVAAARAGKHVLCEKPLATTAADAQHMIEACDAAGVRLMEGFAYRLHPTWVAVRELVAAGRIGRLTAIQTWFGYYNDDPTNIRNLREAGGGALYDIGCYPINLSRLLFHSEPGAVTAMIRRDPVSGVDVTTAAVLEFGDGISTFTCSIRTEPDQRVHVYGTEGRISLGIPFNIPAELPTKVFVTAGGDPPVSPATEVLEFPRTNAYAVQAATFASAVLDGTPLPFEPDDAVANLSVVERVFAAAAATAAAI